MKINEQQAKDYAFLIAPFVKEYIKEHQEEYAAFLLEEEQQEKTQAADREVL